MERREEEGEEVEIMSIQYSSMKFPTKVKNILVFYIKELMRPKVFKRK